MLKPTYFDLAMLAMRNLQASPELSLLLKCGQYGKDFLITGNGGGDEESVAIFLSGSHRWH